MVNINGEDDSLFNKKAKSKLILHSQKISKKC